MTEQINGSDGRKEFERLSIVFTVLFLAILITPVPLVHFLSYVGMVIWIIILRRGFSWLTGLKKKNGSLTRRHSVKFRLFWKEKVSVRLKKTVCK